MTAVGLLAFQKKCKQICQVWLNDFNLFSLFTEENKQQQQHAKKVKHKRSQSNEYLISLPNCIHPKVVEEEAEDENMPHCYEFVEDLLSNDLKMDIHSEPIVSLKETRTAVPPEIPSKNVTCSDNYCAKPSLNNQLTQTNTETRDDSKNRKRCFEETSTVIEKKKRKTMEPKSREFYAYTSHPTWINRRKERRILKHGVNISEKETHERSEEECSDPKIENTYAGSINNIEHEEKQNKYKFGVKLSLTRTTNDKDVCKLKLNPVNDESVQTVLGEFQVFHAFIKKEIVTVFK